MGAIIKAFFLSTENSGSSYLRSGAFALKGCMEQARPGMKELGLLINTGVYRDRHIHEPAIASLIQGDLMKSFGAELAGTFSFDLHSGGGGVVMALSILNGFVESEKTELGVVLAGDSKPFDGSAGALMVGKGGSDEGFRIFSQDTYTQYSSEFWSYSSYSDSALQLINKQDPGYLDHCLQCVKKSMDRFCSESALAADEIDLILPSQSPSGFASALADLLGHDKVVVLNQEHNCYSAGLILALGQAQTTGLFRKSKKILFINVGPGITVDLALYINPS